MEWKHVLTSWLHKNSILAEGKILHTDLERGETRMHRGLKNLIYTATSSQCYQSICVILKKLHRKTSCYCFRCVQGLPDYDAE